MARIRARLHAVPTYLRVVLLLTAVESLIRWVSLPRLARILGVRLDMRPVLSQPPPWRDLSGLSPVARRRLRCTWRATEVWPFGAGPCLRRSLVAAHLLRSSGAAVRIGFPAQREARVAHSWIEVDGRPLEDVSQYQPFAWASARSD